MYTAATLAERECVGRDGGGEAQLEQVIPDPWSLHQRVELVAVQVSIVVFRQEGVAGSAAAEPPSPEAGGLRRRRRRFGFASPAGGAPLSLAVVAACA